MLFFLALKYKQQKQNLLLIASSLLLLFLPFYSLASKNHTLHFTQFAEDQGLTPAQIFEIEQDDFGFIWLASNDGLFRFDGVNFKKFSRDVNNPNSLPNDTVRTILIDSRKTMWVGTQNGLSIYDPEKENFIRIEDSESHTYGLIGSKIWTIFEDNRGALWVATEEKLHKFDRDANRFNEFNILGFTDSVREIKSIYQDDKNNLWIGTFENGLFLLKKNQSQLLSLQGESSSYPTISSNNIFDITPINDEIWISTEDGIHIINQQMQLINFINIRSEDKLFLSIRKIKQINEDTVWIASNAGVYNYNFSTHSTDKLSVLDSDMTVYDIKVDRSNAVWLATRYFGLLKTSQEQNLFSQLKSVDINKELKAISFTQYANSSVFFAGNNGKVYEIIEPNNSIKEVNLTLEQAPIQIFAGENNTLWILNENNNLFKCDLINSACEKSNIDQTILDSFWGNILFHNGVFWLGSQTDELLSYNSHNGQVKRYSSKSVNPRSSMLFPNTIQDGKHIWLSTSENQVLSFNIENQTFKKLNIDFTQEFFDAPINDIRVANNVVWISSFSQGVVSYNKATNKSHLFNVNNGLANNTIASIILDKKGYLWAATSDGISRLNPENNSITNFKRENRLYSNTFINFSAFSAANDWLYFGSSKGVNGINSNHYKTNNTQLYAPAITNIRVANKIVDVDNQNQLNGLSLDKATKQPLLTTSLLKLTQLPLTFNHFPLTLEFILPNASIPSQIDYRYRLIGSDNKWIETKADNRRATYTSLAPGAYTFEVQAIDRSNNTYSPSKTIQLEVIAPWWQSNIAFIVYALIVIIFTAYFALQIRHKRQYHLQIKQSEERLKLSLWGSGDEMWDWNIKTGKIYRSNIWGILEFPQDGKRNVGSDKTNIHSHDIPRVKEALEEHFRQETDVFEATYRVKDKHDNYIWVLDRGKIVERDNQKNPTRMTGTLKDISQIKKAEERLKLFAKCIENISDAVIIYDRQFTAVDVNKSFQRITGRKRSKVVGTTLRFGQYPDSFSQSIKKILIADGSWHGEVENKRDNDEIYLIDITFDVIRDENGNISHFVGVFSDITKRKETEAELLKLANSDTLTGLPNRSYFHANLAQLVKVKTPLALLVFDLDNFKKINDSLGHQVGDLLLCSVAERMTSIGRRNDTIYRLGGDEFSIVIEDTNDIHTITSIAKEILRTVALPFKLKSQEIVLYSSIGIVLFPEDGSTPQELLKNADTAMYHAKDLGGNRYQFFSESMNKQAVKRLQIENLIRVGLRDDYFSVFYQPKIEIKTGRIAGMEALVRFETPKRGVISPVVFIPVSEETGQIIGIGETVLRKSCFATKVWVEQGLFNGRIAVNLSAVQFSQPNLVKMIADILMESKLDPKYLELEITEGTVMDSPQEAIDTMHQIRSMGIHLSLDDFGTGYSSLAYLKKFPLNTLKIDKAFVDDIEHSEQGRNMVATIVTIAHNLDLQVVAEGVETNKQLEFLATLDCEQLQGYLYSKPLATNDFEKYLVSHKITDKSTSFSKL